MKITEAALRKLVREELSALGEEDTANVGKDIKGNAAAEKASEKLSKNKALASSMDQITTSDALAAFLQDVVKIASQKGISQQEAISALKKVLSAAASSSKK